MVPLSETNMALVRRVCDPDLARGLERQSGMCFYPDALNVLLDAARAEGAQAHEAGEMRAALLELKRGIDPMIGGATLNREQVLRVIDRGLIAAEAS